MSEWRCPSYKRGNSRIITEEDDAPVYDEREPCARIHTCQPIPRTRWVAKWVKKLTVDPYVLESAMLAHVGTRDASEGEMGGVDGGRVEEA